MHQPSLSSKGKVVQSEVVAPTVETAPIKTTTETTTEDRLTTIFTTTPEATTQPVDHPQQNDVAK
jgi:hypothetical protein